MDGLSAAASGIAVASLTIQLIESVHKAQRFFRDISDAAKKLERLLDLLEQLELVLDGIAHIIDRQQRQYGNLGTAMAESILKAMRMCESRLSMLGNIVEAAKSASQAVSKSARSFGSLRLACKKKEIEELESQLQQAIGILNLTMTMNLTAVHARAKETIVTEVTSAITKQMISLSSNYGNLTKEPQEPIPKRITTRHKVFQGKKNSVQYRDSSFSICIYATPLGTAVIQKRIYIGTNGDRDGKLQAAESHTREDIIWALMPSFLPYCVQIQYGNIFGSIQGTFRTYPIIPDNHPIWDMCEKEDIPGIQTILGDQRLSPFSVNSKGMTLLHFGAKYLHFEFCKFLFGLSLTDEQSDNYGRRPSYYLEWNSEKAKTEEIKSTYRLFASQDSSIDFAESCPMLFSLNSTSLETFNFLANEYTTTQNINIYSQPPILCAFRCMLNSESESIKGWKIAIRRLIALGADIHNSFGDKYTFLDAIMDLADTPFESRDLGDRWLDVLRFSGVDISDYLRIERAIHFDDLHNPPRIRLSGRHLRERILVISEAGERESVSNDWAMDPRSAAFHVLHEFRHLGPMHHSRHLDYHEPEILYNWPYFYASWQYCLEQVDWERGRLEEKRVASVARERFERRRRRKMTNIARMQGISKGPKIPGAWID